MGSQYSATAIQQHISCSHRWCFPFPNSAVSLLLPSKLTPHLRRTKNDDDLLKFPRDRDRISRRRRRRRTTSTLRVGEGETESESESSSSSSSSGAQVSSTPIVPVVVEESVKVLKNAAKTRKVSAEEVLSALSVIQKAKIDPSAFLNTLGGNQSPGRTWMLIFTAKNKLKGGRYFPLTAVQRFDAAAKRIENGVYLGPIGQLTFEGTLSWKNTRILPFFFQNLRIKLGPLKPLQITLGEQQDREPNSKDPFFIWFYVDEEIAVARGRSGGTAFWCRCHRHLNI